MLFRSVGARRATEQLAPWLQTQKPNVTALRPDKDSKGCLRDERWLVIVNEQVEADE